MRARGGQSKLRRKPRAPPYSVTRRARSRYNCSVESVETPAPSIADGKPPNIPSRRQTEHLAGIPLAGEP